MEYNYGYDPSLAVGNSPTAVLSSVILIIYLISIIGTIVSIIAMWKIYTKAGKPGWASIIPIYNIVVLFEIVELEWWHVLIAIFVPFAAFIYVFVINIKLAKVFGKGVGFTILLLLCPFIGQLILAFGDAVYNSKIDNIVNNMEMNYQNNMNNMNNMNNSKDYSTMNINNNDHYYNAELDHMSQKQINEMVKNNMQIEQNNNQNNTLNNNQSNTLNNNQFNTNEQINEQNIIQQEQVLDNQIGTKPCPVCGSNQVATARECSICAHKFM